MPYDLIPTLTPDDERVIRRVGPKLQELQAQLIELFPAREWLIHQIILALIMGQHVLVFGPHGTAKSLLAKRVFAALTGTGANGEVKQVFTIELDNSTTKDALIGPPSIKKLQEEDIYVPNIAGYLPTAHFANLEEIYEAPGLLRGIHDILNERELREGILNIGVPLMTALATTNRSPEEIVKLYRALQLEPFNDRFAFISQVAYLTERKDTRTMIVNFLMNNGLKATVPFADIQRLVEIINRTNQFPGSAYLDTYIQVIETFKQGTRKTISDRRENWLTQAVEAQAMFMGRPNVLFDDLKAIALGLAWGVNTPEYKVFETACVPVIEAAKQAASENVDGAVVLQLDAVERELRSLRSAVNSSTWPRAKQAAVDALETLKKLDDALAGIKPSESGNEARRVNLGTEVAKLRQTVIGKI